MGKENVVILSSNNTKISHEHLMPKDQSPQKVSNNSINNLSHDIFIELIRKIDAKKDNDVFSVRTRGNRCGNIDFEVNFSKLANYNTYALRHGLLLTDVECSLIQSGVQELYEQQNYTNTHGFLGFCIIDGVDTLKLQTSFSINSSMKESYYTGSVPLAANGSFEDYIEGMKNLIVGNSRLELASILGLCGIATQIIQKPDTHLIVNFSGNGIGQKSSVGKTIGAKLALQHFGNPHALITPSNNTLRDIERVAIERCILPVVWDNGLDYNNTSSKNTRARANLQDITALSSGSAKGKANASMSKFYSPIIMSSEVSIMEQLIDAKTEGYLYSLIEIHCSPGELTKDVQHANDLEQFMGSYHGVSGNAFGGYLMSDRIFPNLHSQYEDWRNTLYQKKCPDRCANRLAIIMLTAELANECFKINIDLPALQDLLIGSIKNTFSQKYASYSATDTLDNYTKQFPQSFAKKRSDFKWSEHLGILDKKSEELRQLVIPSQYLGGILCCAQPQDIIKDAHKTNTLGESELDSILSTWKESGTLMSASKNRFSTKRTLESKTKQQYCYVIKM